MESSIPGPEEPLSGSARGDESWHKIFGGRAALMRRDRAPCAVWIDPTYFWYCFKNRYGVWGLRLDKMPQRWLRMGTFNLEEPIVYVLYCRGTREILESAKDIE